MRSPQEVKKKLDEWVGVRNEAEKSFNATISLHTPGTREVLQRKFKKSQQIIQGHIDLLNWVLEK